MKKLLTLAALAAIGVTITACGGSDKSSVNLTALGTDIQKQAQKQINDSNSGPGKTFVLKSNCMEQQDGKGAKCELTVSSTNGMGKANNETVMVDVTYGKNGQYSWVPAA